MSVPSRGNTGITYTTPGGTKRTVSLHWPLELFPRQRLRSGYNPRRYSRTSLSRKNLEVATIGDVDEVLALIRYHSSALELKRLLKHARDGVEITYWSDLDGDGAPNLLSSPEDLSAGDWSKTGSGVVTLDTVEAPDGQDDVDLLEDDDGATVELVEQSYSITADTNDALTACFVRKTSSSNIVELALEVTDGTTPIIYQLRVDTADGSSDATLGATVSDFNVQDWAEEWYRIWLSGPNGGSGYTTATTRFKPAPAGSLSGAEDAGATGTARAWGFTAERATTPSPYTASVEYPSTLVQAADEWAPVGPDADQWYRPDWQVERVRLRRTDGGTYDRLLYFP